MRKPRDESISCNTCGQTWPRDPAFEVVCPVCNAQVGFPCVKVRPSEHRLSAAFSGQKLHPERDQLAMDRGFLQKCTGPKESK